jgi:chemotaxis protein histidine kinase CheA
MSVQLDQYRELYFSEAREQLAAIASALRKLERAPGERAPLEIVSRATHTLKGMSATMGYDEITVFAHAFEDLLQSVRAHSDGASNGDIYPLFRALDHLNSIISELESGHSRGDDAHAEEAAAAPTGIARASGETSTLVRLSSEQLDHVMAHTIELLASAIRLPHAVANPNEEGELKWREHLALVKQLQAAVWSLRMAPIGDAFNRFPTMLH